MKMYDMTPAEMEKAILGEKNKLDKFIQYVNNVGDILGAPVQGSEILSRASEYVLSRKSGKPQLVALEEAARVTASFSHKGKLGGQVGRAWVSSLPYTNAGIQVLAQFRSAAADPKRQKQVAVTVAMITSLKLLELLPRLFLASLEQKDKYKDLSPEELSRYIFIPHPNRKDWLRFRVPEQMTTLGTLVNMMVLDYMEVANYKAEDYVEAATAWVPEQVNITQGWRAFLSSIPQPLQPSIEVGLNKKTWPRVKDLVPGMQSMEPQFQAFPNTSKVAILLGKQFKLSPIKIDHLVEGYLGRTSRYFMGKPDAWRQLVNPFYRRMYFTAGRRMENYWEFAHENEQLLNSLKFDRREFSEKEIEAIQENTAHIKVIDKALEAYRSEDDPESKEARRLQAIILDEIDMMDRDVPAGPDGKARNWY